MPGEGVEISSRSGRVGMKDHLACGHSYAGVRQDHLVRRVQEVAIDGDTIRLGQLLKLTGIADSGGASKQLLAAGVRVNGAAETRRGRQLHDGGLVEAAGEIARVVASPGAGNGEGPAT